MAETVVETETHLLTIDADTNLIISRREPSADGLISFTKEELGKILYALIAHENTDSYAKPFLRLMLARHGFKDS